MDVLFILLIVAVVAAYVKVPAFKVAVNDKVTALKSKIFKRKAE